MGSTISGASSTGVCQAAVEVLYCGDGVTGNVVEECDYAMDGYDEVCTSSCEWSGCAVSAVCDWSATLTNLTSSVADNSISVSMTYNIETTATGSCAS